jgi:hypothetical protein
MSARSCNQLGLMMMLWGMIVVASCTTVALCDDVVVSPVLPRLAVLELHNRSDYRGHMMGRRAAEGLQAALGSIGRWELIERGQVRRECREMDLQPPFAVGYQQALGHKLRADMLLTGYVEQVRISSGDGTVAVHLALDIVDRICGQPVASLQAQGSARRTKTNPSPTDVIVSKALQAACLEAAEIASTMPLYSAVVTSISGGAISLDTVQPAAAAVGDRLLLYRMSGEPTGPRLVGVLMVTEVERGRVQTAVMGTAGELYREDTAVCVGPIRPAQ